MGYGSDDRFDNRWRDRGDDRWDERGWRGEGRGGYGRGDDDRGFFERAGDEVRSWFGDDDAQRRREHDERRWEHEQRMTGRRDNDPRSGGSGWMAGGWGNQRGESWHRDRPGERGWPGGSERDEREGWFSSSVGGERGERWGGPEGRQRGDFERSYGGRSRPVGESFGAGASAGSGGYGSPSAGRGGDLHDPHYSEWRRRQIEDLDRDYDEYRREHQSKFEQEFGGWREKRRGQRQMLGKVAEHMEVVGSDGTHVGKVDKVRGDRIILAKSDPNAGGMHHSVPCGWVETVEDKVTLNRTAQAAMESWRNEDNGRALFEREDQGSEGPHALDRSFSGTYGGRDAD